MQVICSCSNIPGFNLAAEEYLFSRRRDEILFLYVNDPCVVIGCNQALLSEADTDYCSAHAVSVCRRMSGGGAVYHDPGNLNYCFIKNRVPGTFPLGAEFLEPIVQVLKALNIAVQVGQRKDLWLDGDKKISGTASHVGKDRELHHGTLLYNADLEKLQRVLSPKSSENKFRAIASVPSPVMNIMAYFSQHGMDTPSAPDFIELFTQKIQAYYNLDTISYLTPTETEHIQIFMENKYETVAWTYKR